MKKKLLSLALAALLAASSFVGASAATFSDTAGHWAESAIERWSGYGVINGYNGRFMPNDKITRGEMAVILDKLMGYQVAAENTFHDLKAGMYYTEPILKANAAGAMNGDGKGGVRPTANITRQEAAVLIANALGVGKSSSRLTFSDAASVASWAYGYVAALADRGIVSGETFRPAAAITRAEVVTMLDNAISLYAPEARVYSSFSTFEDVVVRGDGTQLVKATVMRDLILTEGVGDGAIKLSGVKVFGRLIIRGGSEIVLNQCQIGSVVNTCGAKIVETNDPVVDPGAIGTAGTSVNGG